MSFFSRPPGAHPENDVGVVYSDIELDDFDVQTEQLSPYDASHIKVTPGRFRGHWTSARLANNVLIARWTVNCGLYNHVDCPEGWFGLSVPLGPPGTVVNGVELDRNHLVMTAPGSELELDIPARAGHFLVFSIEQSALEAIVGKDTGSGSIRPGLNRTSVVRASSTAGAFIESALSLLRLCGRAPDSRLPKSLVTNLLDATFGALDFELALDDKRGREHCKSSYAIFAESRESFAGMAEFDYEALAAAVGRCPRAIQMAFAEHARTTPYRYFRNLKLHRARKALLAGPGDRAATIGDIAAMHGFWNWGRFTRLYRQQFGETPSQTRVRLKGRQPSA